MGASLDRELIAEALRARIETLCPDFVGVTRRYRPISEVDPSSMPLAIVGVGAQSAIVLRGMPSSWKITFPVYLYVASDEADAVSAPSTRFNALVKAVEDAMERQATEAPWDLSELYSTNLGLANVKSVRVTSVETDEGLLDPLGMAVLAIDVEATN